jgi:lipopolysaccharide transport system permease protein
MKPSVQHVTNKGSLLEYCKEIGRFRELLYTLSWRDIKVKYKQTLIGASWSVLRPLITSVLFVIVFSRIGRMPNMSGAPYLLMVFAGMLPWQFFANTLSEVGFSVVNNAGLIGKVYFPRIIIPLAAILTNMVDFLVSLIILVVMMIWYQCLPGWELILFPVFIVLLAACALGAGLFLAVLNVQYRDVKFVVPFLIQIGLFATPIAYSSSNVPDQWRLLYALNPLVGIISGIRWCLLGDPIYWTEVWISVIIIALLLTFGMYYFRKMEKTFADTI